MISGQKGLMLQNELTLPWCRVSFMWTAQPHSGHLWSAVFKKGSSPDRSRWVHTGSLELWALLQPGWHCRSQAVSATALWGLEKTALFKLTDFQEQLAASVICVVKVTNFSRDHLHQLLQCTWYRDSQGVLPCFKQADPEAMSLKAVLAEIMALETHVWWHSGGALLLTN